MEIKGTENASLNTSTNGPGGKVRKSRANRMANAPSTSNNNTKEDVKIATEANLSKIDSFFQAK